MLHPDIQTKALDRHFLRYSPSPQRHPGPLHLAMQPCAGPPRPDSSERDSDLTSLSSKADAIGSKTACTLLGNAFKETMGSQQLYFSQLK